MVASKRAPLLVGLGALMLLGAGGLLLWQLTRRNLDRGLPVGTRAVPADTLLTLSFNTDVSQWQRLRQYGTPETQAEFDQFLARWRDRIFLQYGFDYGQDIKPWVGSEITVAFLSPPDVATNPESTPLPEDTAYAVALLPIANPQKAQTAFANQEVTEVVQEYQGVEILSLDSDASDPIYGALLGTQLIAVGRQVSSLEQTIDAYEGRQSLATRSGVGAAFEPITTPNTFLRIYVDMPAVARTLAEGSQPPLPANLAAFSQPRGLAGAVVLESRGIRFQGISWLEPGSDLTFEAAPSPSLMPQQLPADMLLMASTSNFATLWQTFQADNTLGALLPFRLQDLALSLEAATGLTLEEDFLPWMNDELALGILAPSALPTSTSETPPSSEEDEDADKQSQPLPNPALIALAQASQRQLAEQTFEQLDQVMADRYSFTVDRLEIAGEAVIQWTAPFGGLSLSHGWFQENIAFLTVGQGVPDVLMDSASLTQNRLFELTTRAAPNPNNGYFFIDLQAMNTAQDSLLLPPLPEDGWVTAEAIEAVGVTATVLGERQVRYDLFAALSRGKRPGPLPSLEAPAEVPSSEEQGEGDRGPEDEGT